MFCTNCGSQLNDSAVICPHCGVATENFNAPRSAAPAANDAPSAGFAVLCFFFPVVGLILYLVWHDTMPLRARSCGRGALISVIIYAALIVFIVILVVGKLSCAAALIVFTALIVFIVILVVRVYRVR